MYNSKQLKQMTSLHLIVVFNCLSLYWLDVNLLHIHLSMVLLQIYISPQRVATACQQISDIALCWL